MPTATNQLLGEAVAIVDDQTERIDEFLGASERTDDPGLARARAWLSRARAHLATDPAERMDEAEIRRLAQGALANLRTEQPFTWVANGRRLELSVDDHEDLILRDDRGRETRIPGRAAELRDDDETDTLPWLAELLRDA